MTKRFTMLWRPTSGNSKTGNIPQGYVGATRDEVEKSCDGCQMRRKGCYYWNGQASGGHNSMQRRFADKPVEYSLRWAINKSVRSARYVRGAVGGDPWVFDRDTVSGWADDIRAAGMRGLLLYTHFAADKGSHLKGLAMASVHSLTEADDRIREGWRTAMVAEDLKAPGSRKPQLRNVPEWSGETFTTPDGVKGVVCPAQVKRGINCNTCGMCDASKAGPRLIVFLKH
jgi:hypothetical protein